MAITDFATYKSLLTGPVQKISAIKSMTTSNLPAGAFSSWTFSPNPGSAPTTSVVPTGDLASGGMGQADISNQRIGQITSSAQTNTGIVLCDRLVHSGGLDGTVTGAQATNLPSAALTRYTDGIGVWAGIEIYSAVGTTSTTITVSYTNTDNNSSTSPAILFGGTGHREAGRIIPVTLAQGDKGVKAVASVNIVASTTTAGNFGITLFKPLCWIPYTPVFNHITSDGFLGLGGMMPAIPNSSCLFWMLFPSTNGQTVGTFMTESIFIQDA